MIELLDLTMPSNLCLNLSSKITATGSSPFVQYSHKPDVKSLDLRRTNRELPCRKISSSLKLFAEVVLWWSWIADLESNGWGREASGTDVNLFPQANCRDQGNECTNSSSCFTSLSRALMSVLTRALVSRCYRRP